MAGDWFKVYRKIVESQVWPDEVLVKLWVWCLTRANFRDTWVSIDGLAEPVRVKRGQFVTGRHALHKEYYPKKRKRNLSSSALWRRLELLKTMRNVNIQTNSRYSLVTIVKYNLYQGEIEQIEQPDEQVIEQQLNSSCTAGEQPVNTEKKDKKVKKEQEGKETLHSSSPPSGDGATPPTAFDEWWALWPVGRKIARQGAVKAYVSAVKRLRVERSWTPQQCDAFLAERVAAFAASPCCAGDYCPHPATWLNNGRYDDDPESWKDSGGQRDKSQLRAGGRDPRYAD